MQGWSVKGTRSKRREATREDISTHLCFTLDERAAAVAKGRGALDVALGETFVALSQGGRLMDLGCSRLVDFAYERLGLPKRTTFMLRQLAVGLASRPLLRKAVAVGAVSSRKALLVMPVAIGEDEAAWVGAAMHSTCAALKEQVKGTGVEVDPSFAVESSVLSMTPEQQDRLDEALMLANRVLGVRRKKWIRMECIAQEFLSSFPDWVPDIKEEARGAGHTVVDPATRERVEKAVLRQLAALEEAAEVIAGMDGDPAETNAMALDARAKRLAKARLSRDSALGPLLVTIFDQRMHRHIGYGSFTEYCRDRLGMTARAARQRIWLERKMCALPELRTALDRGTISYSKALVVAKGATHANTAERIADAATTTCQQVEREARKEEDRKNRAQGRRRLWGPQDAMKTVSLAMTAARRFSAEQGEIAGPGEALEAMAELFVSVWTANLKGPKLSKKRESVLARTDGVCAVPGCEYQAEHLHHIKLRSRGGGDEETNLIGVCESCHQRGIHRGRIRVVGKAGELLTWELGLVNGKPVEVWTTVGGDDVRRGVGKGWMGRERVGGGARGA